MFKSHKNNYRIMNTSTGVAAGGVLGAGVTYFLTKPKIQRLEAENKAKEQQNNALHGENQTLRNTIFSQKNVITQKDEVIRQKDNLLAMKDAEITKLKEERKRVLSN